MAVGHATRCSVGAAKSDRTFTSQYLVNPVILLNHYSSPRVNTPDQK
ncbi:MAG: hypothetical protein F6K55_17965 [Moorea sp. SIO4A3]|nr:hypothetical protein [Moorena sp. SIO4A3]